MTPTETPKPASTVGPKVMTFSGLAVIVVGVVGLVFAVMILFGTVTTTAITASGQPGDGAIAAFTATEGGAFDSPGGYSYDLWQVQPSSGESASLTVRDVTVTGPGGFDVPVRGSQVATSLTVGTSHASTFASFSATDGGTYTITVAPDAGFVAANPAESNSTAVDVVVTESTQFVAFFTGIFGTVGVMLAGIAGILVGGGLLLAGTIWWVIVRNRTTDAAAGS